MGLLNMHYGKSKGRKGGKLKTGKYCG